MCGEDVAWERGQHWTSVRPGRTISLPRRLAQTHDIGWLTPAMTPSVSLRHVQYTIMNDIVMIKM